MSHKFLMKSNNNINSPSGRQDVSLKVIDKETSNIYVSSWDPESDDTWSMFVNGNKHANLAQASEWYSIIKRAYSHTPLYLKAENTEGHVALLPSFLVRSRLIGTVITSMPFLDAGGPCTSSPSLTGSLLDALAEEAKKHGASRIELRCTVEMNLPFPAMKEKVNLFLPLPSDADRLWRQLNAKIRNQVRKAERSGLSVEFGGLEKLNDFYEIFAVNMRDLGSPVHSKQFFSAIFDSFGDKARIALVRKDRIPIGGLVALAFKNTITVPWASSLRQYFSLCPNMLLYWETLRVACKEGFRRFDFGRSSQSSSTYHFKRQWGALEEPLFWYTIPIDRNHQLRLSAASKQGAFLLKIWKHLPLRFSRCIGPHVRKYLTQ